MKNLAILCHTLEILWFFYVNIIYQIYWKSIGITLGGVKFSKN